MSVRPFALRIFSHQCPGAPIRPALHKNGLLLWRPFASSAIRCAARKQPKQPKPSRQPELVHIEKAPRPSFGSIGTLAAKLAREREHTLLLYKSPSHRTYLFSAYGLSAFCFAYAVYNSNMTFADPITDLPMWQKALFGGICVTMSVMGTLFMTRTTRLVQRINAGIHNDGVIITFHVRRMVPFRNPYLIRVPASKVSFARRLVVSPESRERFENDTVRTGPTAESRPTFFKAPIRALSTLLWRIFMSVRQVFTGEDFILLNIEGHKGTLRMDANGWVSQDFYALGNPVQVRDSSVQRR
ncbi:uncharacterized protein N7459_000305 [Penicillium hispanicum]|uniref:uncharacterized protein n=1 Tax=Penicillium hispanicum TaxID=1080232 RepID=UPI002540C5B5|nr:uncharacterized protein N7459_000305 [Penicillium hispanicum]KAJ5594097.1 hypothetical protein N7459_000305 [Penicillium hispanicum]